MNAKLAHKLLKRQEEGTMRSLLSFEGSIDFFSNDYLGMSQVENQVVLKGATGSRLISGNTNQMETVERQLANFFNTSAGLFYQSGYAANIGFFSCVPQKGDIVLFDEDCHASIRDGLRLSTAQSFKFSHNDLLDLEHKLEKYKHADCLYVVVEGLYSMSGKMPNVEALDQLVQKYGAELIVDEAHSAGVFGEEGRGLFEGVDCTRLITFGKAYGAHGALWLCSEDLRNYLINFSRSFIYTTATPLAVMEHALDNVQRVSQRNDRMKLQENIALFRSLVPPTMLVSDDQSPIQMIQLSDRRGLKDLEAKLIDSNFAVKAIYEPTVQIEKEGLRISLHSFNTNAEIKSLSAILAPEN